MYFTQVVAEGFRSGDTSLEADAGVVQLPGGAHGQNVARAIRLLRLAYDPERRTELPQIFGALPTDPVDVEYADGLISGASAASGWDAAAIVRSGVNASIRVRATVHLDPPAWARLREVAVREPRLASGLADRTLTVSCGWLFSKDLRSVAIHPGTARVGTVEVPATGPDAPRWLVPFVRELLSRVRLGADQTEDAALQAYRSARFSDDDDLRARADAASRALAEAPFLLGALDLVLQDSGSWSLCLGPSRARPATLGPGAQEAIGLAVQVLVDRPDVWIGYDPALHLHRQVEVRTWLDHMCQDEGAPMEQVLLLGSVP